MNEEARAVTPNSSNVLIDDAGFGCSISVR
jgi:hypothetical protein